jgi:hypothetical protein
METTENKILRIEKNGNLSAIDKSSHMEANEAFKRKTNLSIGMTLLFGMLIFASACTSSAKKVKNAEEGVSQAQEELYKAQQDYEADVELFKITTANRIAQNDKEVIDIKLKIKESNSKYRADYEKQIAALELKNKELTQKMNDYKAETNADWQAFKSELNRDLDELGIALKNFAVESK